MKKMCVYILHCSDDSFYTGVTNEIERRISEHNNGSKDLKYTYSRRPFELVFTRYFNSATKAIAFEKQVKGWTRKKKQALIRENWKKLKELAECKNETSHKNLKKRI